MEIRRIPLRWLLPALVAAGLALVPVALAVVRFSRVDDRTCLRCHGTALPDRALDTWHADLSCVDCHREGDDWLHGRYRAAQSSVQVNCLGCHEDLLLGRRALRPAEGRVPLHFDHGRHASEHGAQCVECHREILHPKLARDRSRPSKATCLGACHADADERSACQVCHDEADTAAPLSPRSPSEAACRPCHRGFDARPAAIAGRPLRHWLHAAAGVECGACHPAEPPHGTTVAEDACLACHHGQRAERPCERCHRSERDWRAGNSGGGPQAGPEPMLGLADCTDCHPDVAKGALRADPAATLAACAECHAEDEPPRDLPGIVAGWSASHTEALLIVEGKDRIDPAAGRPRPQDGIAGLLASDPSRGAHNPGLTAELLRIARGLAAALGSPGPEGAPPAAPGESPEEEVP